VLFTRQLCIHREAEGLYPDEGVYLPSQLLQQTYLEESMPVDDEQSASRRSELLRCRQTSLRVKRRSLLNSIHEKSQSIDMC